MQGINLKSLVNATLRKGVVCFVESLAMVVVFKKKTVLNRCVIAIETSVKSEVMAFSVQKRNIEGVFDVVCYLSALKTRLCDLYCFTALSTLQHVCPSR